MDVIEKAIRSAFDKGTPDDRAFRERVYRQAFAALDRALQANPGSTVENAIARRKQLQAMIVEIESEFIPAVQAASPRESALGGEGHEPHLAPAGIDAPSHLGPRPATPDMASPDVHAPDVASARGDSRDPRPFGDPATSRRADPEVRAVEPEFSLDPFLVEPGADVPPAPVLPPQALPPGLPDVNVAAERVLPARGRRAGRGRAPATSRAAGGYDPRLRQRRGSFRGAIAIFLLLALIGSAGWLAVRQGVIELPIGRNTGEVRTQQPDEAENFAPEEAGAQPPPRPAAAEAERTWITVFEPADPTRVSAPADASAEVMQDESGAFLRIRSGKSGSAVAFDVGQGVLEQLSGKKAVFDIIARAEGGGQSEMSVDCNFGELGDCGRKRYAVGYERGEYLFEVEFPAIDPGAGGTIAVNSDFAGQGRAIDIYEIRVAAE